MKKTVLILLASALSLAGVVSCHQQDQPEGSVTLTFSTAAPVTRVGNGNAADGGGIVIDGSGNPDLFIAIANYSGDVVATYTGTNTTNAELVGSAAATQVSVRFKNITAGEYTVFALANIADQLWGAPSASAWNDLTTVNDGNDIAYLDGLTFTDLGDYGTLSVGEGDRMPLSAKGTLSITENLNGHVELEMLRCVGKVGFRFKNETDATLTLTNCTVSIEKINPTTGYLFPRSNDADATGTARDISLSKNSISINSGAAEDLYDMRLVFPSVAPASEQTVGSRYYCNITFTVGGEEMTFTKLPIHDKQSQDIQALGRNQYLQIETRINEGLNISFNFEVKDWTNKQEDISFH